jgi:hypothetical protein
MAHLETMLTMFAIALPVIALLLAAIALCFAD